MELGKTPFSVEVYWQVSDLKHWTYLGDELRKKTGIIKYRLYVNKASIWDWKLEFECEEHYDYHFKDESGDEYRKNVFANGIHPLSYNSDLPNIVRITGK